MKLKVYKKYKVEYYITIKKLSHQKYFPQRKLQGQKASLT